MVCMMNVVNLVGGNTYPAQWFPRKKGIALGWATVGLNIAGAVVVPLLTALTAKLGGIKYALWVLAGALVVMFIINCVAFKNYPEEWNAYPDNDPNFKHVDPNAARTGWTTKALLKDKDFWKMGLGNGIYALITIGFVSTLVPTMISRGYPQPVAVSMMAITSVLGLAGSYVCGFLDQKLGAQKAAIIYGLFVFVAIVFFFIPGNTANWIYVIMMGLSVGGSNNYPPSMTAQIYGRAAFAKAFPLIYFIKGLISAFPFLILGQSVARTGSYNTGWVVFAVLCLIGTALFYFTNLNPKKDPLEK